jgi:hypothetical protein
MVATTKSSKKDPDVNVEPDSFISISSLSKNVSTQPQPSDKDYQDL